jgi:hypothetical protein
MEGCGLMADGSPRIALDCEDEWVTLASLRRGHTAPMSRIAVGQNHLRVRHVAGRFVRRMGRA